MYIPVHRVQQLIEYSQLADELSEADRALQAEDVNIFLEVLNEEATQPARDAFIKRMEDLPEEQWPWSAVRTRPGAPIPSVDASAEHKSPPALTLLMGQSDDYADWDEKGNFVPDYGTKEADAYENLYDALFSWETGVLLTMAGPLGWTAVQLSVADEVAEAGKQAIDDTAEAVEDAKKKVGEVVQDVKGGVTGAADEAAKTTWKIAKPILIGAGALAGVVVIVSVVKAVG